MSTNINISVGDNKLLDQARLQQNASRQAQLEKEASKRLQSQAIDARTKANAAAGKDANGNPLYGVPTAKPDIDRRPAANREPIPNFGEAYYSIDLGENDQYVVSVASADGTASLVYPIPGSEKPLGYRDRAGADRLPYLDNPVSLNDPYLSETTEEVVILDRPSTALDISRVTQTLVEHTGVTDGEPVFETTARGAGSGGWAKFFSTSYGETIFLPIGKDIGLLVVLTSRYSGKSYSVRNRTVVWDRDNLLETNTLVSYESTTTIEQEEHTQSEQATAFLVGKSTVKLVQAPSSFVQTLKTRNYWSPITLSAVEGTGTTTEFIAVQIPLQSYTFTGTRYFNTEEYNNSLTIKNDMIFTWLYVATWGIPYASSLRFTASPGIYDILRSDLAQVPFPWLRASIQNYVASVGQKIKWLRLVGLPPPSDQINIQEYRGILPADYGDDNQFDESQFKTVKRITAFSPPPQTYQYKIFFIDWNKPAYCRQQALALGFTEADLTP